MAHFFLVSSLVLHPALAQVSTGSAHPQNGEIAALTATRTHPQIARAGGMVVSDDRVASEWGAEILRRGGNAVDAAVATALALAVTRPHFASLGGGGFLLYCPPVKGSIRPACQALDYRERAPRALTRDAFVRVDGTVDTRAAQVGARAAGVPGTVAGLLTALQKWGRVPRAKVLERPVVLARSGVAVTEFMENSLREQWKNFNPEMQRLFACGHAGEPCRVGERLTQPELARLLGAIGARGVPAFYVGEHARKLVEGLRASGGVMTLQDLAEYRPIVREALVAQAFGQEIVTMPPPSSGGGVMLAILKLMERAQRGAVLDGFGSARWLRALAFAEASAFADRAQFYGDPDFVPGLVAQTLPRLLSDAALDAEWARFNVDGPWKNPPRPEGGASGSNDGDHTTHLSVIDADGGAVALTTTINESFGSGFMPPGTGVVMNNEIDDFSLKPGVANAFGLVGAEANAIAPGKRPLSSMTPTITRDALSGEVRMVIGAAGGPRIITSVAQVLLNRWIVGMSLPDAVAAPRAHHQWLPDEVKIERFGFAPEVQTALSASGLKIVEVPGPLARIYALERFANGRIWAAPDPRGEGEVGVAAR